MLRAVVALAWWVIGISAAMPDPAEDAAHTAKSAADAIILTGPVGALFILVVIGLVVALAAAGLVIRALWNTIKERDVATAAMRKDYDAAIVGLHEKRAAELVENTKQVAQTAISGSAAITASNDRLTDVSGRVSILAERLLAIPTEIADIKTALLAGHARMLRLQKAGDRVAATGNTEAAAAIAERQNEIRAGLDDLARRLD